MLLPTTERGGITLAVATAGDGDRPSAYRDLFTDGATALSNPKFLDKLRDDTAAALAAVAGDAAAEAAVKKAARVEVMNFLDTVKAMFLHEDVLAETDPSLAPIALTADDPRFLGGGGVFSTPSAAEGNFGDFAIRTSAVFREAEGLRGDGEGSVDAGLAAAFPELYRLIYPDGEVQWTDDTRADVITRDAAAVRYYDSEFNPSYALIYDAYIGAGGTSLKDAATGAITDILKGEAEKNAL